MKFLPNISLNTESIDWILKSNCVFYAFKTIRKALIYFSDKSNDTISAMCLVSLSSVSAKPGVSMRITSLFDPLQNSFLLVVKRVSDLKLALTLNSF